MSVPCEFLDVCYLQYKQARSLKFMSPTGRMLFHYSALRLAKIGMASKKNVEMWQEVFDTVLAEALLPLPPEHGVTGETTRLPWGYSLALAWLTAREGTPEMIAELDQAAADLCANGHRNEEGLFDDAANPGALSTEILAMTLPVLAWAGKATGKSAYFEEALFQMKGYMEKLYDKETHLWHPGYLPGPASKAMWIWWQGTALYSRVAPKKVGRFSGYWGRGEGYALFALSELVFELPTDHKDKEFLLAAREEMLSALLPCQDELGMFHQVLNEFGSYEETTSTAWILYALGRGIKRGTVNREKFIPPYLKGFEALTRYLGCDGSIFNGSTGQQCPGGRGTGIDYAMVPPKRNEPVAFAPVMLALQQAAQIRNHTELIPEWRENLENNGGGAK